MPTDIPHRSLTSLASLPSHPSNPLQKRTGLTFPEEEFSQLVAEIGQDFKSDLRYEPDAVLALQTAAEDYLVELFEARDLFAFYVASCHAAALRSHSHTSIRRRALNAFTPDEKF